HGLDLLADAGKKALGVLQPRTDPFAPPRYLEATLQMKDVNLEAFIRRLDLQLPVEVAGRLSFEVRAGIPIDTPRDVKAYRLDGTAVLPYLTVAGLRLEDVRPRLVLADGILRLVELRVRVEGFPADGSARLYLADSFRYDGRLSLVAADVTMLRRQ